MVRTVWLAAVLPYSKIVTHRNRGLGAQPANFCHRQGNRPASQPISVAAAEIRNFFLRYCIRYICNVLIHNVYVLVASLLSLTILPKQPNNAFPPPPAAHPSHDPMTYQWDDC